MIAEGILNTQITSAILGQLYNFYSHMLPWCGEGEGGATDDTMFMAVTRYLPCTISPNSNGFLQFVNTYTKCVRETKSEVL